MKNNSSISNHPKKTIYDDGVVYTKVKTEDGYTFYIMPNGKVVDNLDPDLIDLSYDSIEEFENDPFTPNIYKEV